MMRGVMEHTHDAAQGYFKQTRREITPLLPASPTKVLELGCGAGATVSWLRTIRDITYAEGVELSAAHAERAKSHFDLVHVGDLDEWPFTLTQSDFDLVLTLDVLEHLRDPWSALNRVRAHMHPEGTLIASIPNVAHYSVALPLAVHGRFDYTKWGLLDRTHLRFFTRDTVRAMFQDCGFQIERIEANRLHPDLFGAIGLKTARWRWYNQRLLDALLPHRLFDFQFLIVARPA